MNNGPVARPSPAKRLKSILRRRFLDPEGLESDSIHADELPAPRNTEPLTLEDGEQPIKITIDELKESCSMDEQVIQHIQSGSLLTRSHQEFMRQSLSIADDAFQRITRLLNYLAVNGGEHGGPSIVPNVDPPQMNSKVQSHSGFSSSGGPKSAHIATTPPSSSGIASSDGYHHTPPSRRHSQWKAAFPYSLSADVWAGRIFFVQEVIDTLDDLISLREESARASRNSNLAPVTFEALCCTRGVIRMLEQLDYSRPVDDDIEAALAEEQSAQTWGMTKNIDVEVAPDGSHIGTNSVGDSGYASGQQSSTQATAHKAGAMMETVSEEDDMDNETIYSSVSVVPRFQSAYIEEFSRCLADDARLLADSALGAGLTFPSSTSQLLKSFARRLHGEASSDPERKVSAFLHQHRGKIADSLGHMALSQSPEVSDGGYESEEEDESFAIPFRRPEPDVTQWVASQLSVEADGRESDDIDAETSYIPPPPQVIPMMPIQANEYDDGISPGPEKVANVETYQDFVKQSAAYDWLLSKIRVSWLLRTPGTSQAMSDISASIATRILSHPIARKVSSRLTPVTIEMKVSLEWDLRTFIKEQQYDVKYPGDILDRACCLTGTWTEAQAVTPLQYLKQVWPSSFAPIYELMKRFLSFEAEECDYHSPTNCTLQCQQQDASFHISMIGPLDFVLETAEQLAWLASALRPSPFPWGAAACRPTIADVHTIDGKKTQRPDVVITGSCTIEFAFEQAPERLDSDATRGGFCWSDLFRNPVLVTGYPIALREVVETGLEISLGFMALLVDSYTVFRIGYKMILKGFCSCLVAVEATKDLVLWHLLFNPSGERISFSDERIGAIGNISVTSVSLRGLEPRRHIVGWCGDIKEYSGHPNANWDILPSGLDKPPKSFVIDKIYLEVGQYVAGGFMGSIGRRDQPVYLLREKSHRGLVNWVSSQPIVIYDVADCRAWLIDGASALLHLVRASIHQDRQRPAYKSGWKFDEPLEGDNSYQGGSRAAIEALTSTSNLNRSLYLDDIRPAGQGQMEEVHYNFRDRVKEILHHLQVLVDQQARVASQDGYWIPQSAKMGDKTVVGYDFWDVANPPGPIWSRAYYPKTGGHGWIDYIRAIRATTLFGRNFGELLQATTPGDLCPDWRIIPTGAEYLGVSVATLKTLHDAMNRAALAPGELTSDIIWASQLELFSHCECTSASTVPGSEKAHPHLDPVQLLLPKGRRFHLDVPKIHNNVSLQSLGAHGAVLFGHTRYMVAIWDRISRGDHRSLATDTITSSGDNSSSAGGSTGTTPATSSTPNTVPNSIGTHETTADITPVSSSHPDLSARDQRSLHSGGLGRRLAKKPILQKLFQRRR